MVLNPDQLLVWCYDCDEDVFEGIDEKDETPIVAAIIKVLRPA